jgi:hypothetical protein
MDIKREQALAMKKELEDGLERWSQQVLEVQESNMKRAEGQVESKKKLIRQRSREERRSRERRVREKRKESKEREEEELKIKRIAIDTKEKRVNMRTKQEQIILTIFSQVDSIIREREQSIERQRLLAAKAARLRRTIR